MYHLVFQSYSFLWITDYTVLHVFNAKSSQMYTYFEWQYWFLTSSLFHLQLVGCVLFKKDKLIPITIAKELIVHISLNNYIAWRLIFLNINILWLNQKIRQLALTSPYQFFAIHLRFRFLLKIYAIKYKQHITKNLMECFNS